MGFTEIELDTLKQHIANFNYYYEDNKIWDFDDLEDQRLIAVEIVKILEGKI